MIPKFRVWDRKSNEMFLSDEVVVQIKGQDVLVALEDSLHQIQDFSLMLSTGLYAKYQTEIYEKDIVSDSYGDLFLVEWLDGAFVLTEYYNGGYDHHYINDSSNLEVIGNEYENPELLKEMVE